MNLLKYNYYGYEKNRFRDCKDLIHDTNYRHLTILNTWFLCLTIVFMFLSWNNRFGTTRRSFRMYLFFMLVSLLSEVFLVVFKNFSIKYAPVFVYLNTLILMGFGIYSSMMQPYLTATMFLVLVVLLSVAYIDTMVSTTVTMIFYSSVFLYTSYTYKSSSLAQLDVYNVTVFLILALVLHYTFQRAKMQQFYTLQRNIQIQRDLEIRSSFDTLTDLLNRARFFSIAAEIISKYTSGDEYIAVCLLDLDKFKQINDTLGHQMGDKAIQVTANIIAETLQINMLEKWSFTNRAAKEQISFAGRLGGDEYIMFIRGLNNEAEVDALLKKVLNKLNSVKIGELNGIHGSFGVTALSPDDKDIDTAYNRADEALYRSKEAGKNCITFN